MIPIFGAANAARRRSVGPYRYPWYWSYAASSYWNIGIGSNATFGGTGDSQMTAVRAAQANVNVASNYGQPIYIATATDPLVTFTAQATDFPSDTFQFRVPANAVPAGPVGGGSDASATFYDQSNPRWKVSCNQITFNNGTDVTGGITAYFVTIMDVTGDGVTQTSFPPGVTKAGNADYDFGAGTITQWDLQQGAINHMLRYAAGDNLEKSWGASYTDNIPWPMHTEDFDGPTAYTGNLYVGQCLAIPKSVDTSGLGLSTGGQMLAQCLKTYGMQWRDTSSNGAITLYMDQTAQNDPNFQGIVDDWSKLLPLMQRLTNQSTDGSPGTINGGGTYPPPPPDFDPALGIGAGR